MIGPQFVSCASIFCVVLILKSCRGAQSPGGGREFNFLDSFPVSEPSAWKNSKQALQEDCAMNTLWRFLSLDGLNDMVEFTAIKKGIEPALIAQALAELQGLEVKVMSALPPSSRIAFNRSW